MIVGAHGEVYSKMFAVFGSSVECEVTEIRQNGSQGRKLDVDKSKYRLGTCMDKLEFMKN